jgi:cytochrome c-type biogenesis protein CcmE
MKVKIVIASVVIILAILFGAKSFVESNIEYGDLQTAMTSNKKIQVKGEWVKEKESFYEHQKGQFIFFMKDDKGEIAKVVLDGAKPNNFEIANSIVVKGRYQDGYFHATEVLTKCPSKYQTPSEASKKIL